METYCWQILETNSSPDGLPEATASKTRKILKLLTSHQLDQFFCHLCTDDKYCMANYQTTNETILQPSKLSVTVFSTLTACCYITTSEINCIHWMIFRCKHRRGCHKHASDLDLDFQNLFSSHVTSSTSSVKVRWKWVHRFARYRPNKTYPDGRTDGCTVALKDIQPWNMFLPHLSVEGGGIKIQ